MGGGHRVWDMSRRLLAKRIPLAVGIAAFVTLVFLLRFFVIVRGSSAPPSLGITSFLSPDQELRAQYHSAAAAAAAAAAWLAPSPAPAVDMEEVLEELIQQMISESSSSSGTPMLSVWDQLKPAMARQDLFPEARKSVTDALLAWKQLMQEQQQLHDQQQNSTTGNNSNSSTTLQCPPWVNSLSPARDVNEGSFVLSIPCGLVLDSSITLVGVPMGAPGDFRIDLVGQAVPGETEPPIILHHNIRLRGDQLTASPVLVQNTWTQATDWEDEERCPSSSSSSNKTVDGLAACSAQVGANATSSWGAASKWRSSLTMGHYDKPWFPYAEGHPFAATLWVGWDGFHMTVDGKHITSFEYRQNLEPWMVSQVIIDGSLQISSVIATGLPTSENLETLPDLELLKAPALEKEPEFFIGIVSTANNFERRMAVRRSWMQYQAVRSGKVAVRFFVGLHQNQQVNRELWKEAMAYGDIQLLPFVDYYNLITLKTLAICIFATQVANAKYIMKTDDDTFVRVQEVLAAVKNTNMTEALLYGSIESDSKPDRNTRSKWYITEEEWSLSGYPPWAHGPGYIVSNDIAKFVVKMNHDMNLKLFKLEDVAMGAWIEDYRLQTQKNVSYVNDVNFHSDGCKAGYMIAHYQNPRQMVCLWNQLRQGAGAVCC